METLVAYTFRFVLYTFFGLSMEIAFSVLGIERTLGCALKRRMPRKYLEGFVSLYMVPMHGFGLLFLFEPASAAISDWFIGARFALYAVGITCMEILWGWILMRVRGFYPWDYYADSKYKMLEGGYSLWTLIPQWGIAGLILEVYCRLLVDLSPHAVAFFTSYYR